MCFTNIQSSSSFVFKSTYITDQFNRAGTTRKIACYTRLRLGRSRCSHFPLRRTTSSFLSRSKTLHKSLNHVLSGKGKKGFSDKHREQLIILISSHPFPRSALAIGINNHAGPKLTSGPKLAADASEALGVEIEFEDISPYVQSHLDKLRQQSTLWIFQNLQSRSQKSPSCPVP